MVGAIAGRERGTRAGKPVASEECSSDRLYVVVAGLFVIMTALS